MSSDRANRLATRKRTNRRGPHRLFATSGRDSRAACRGASCRTTCISKSSYSLPSLPSLADRVERFRARGAGPRNWSISFPRAGFGKTRHCEQCRRSAPHARLQTAEFRQNARPFRRPMPGIRSSSDVTVRIVRRFGCTSLHCDALRRAPAATNVTRASAAQGGAVRSDGE